MIDVIKKEIGPLPKNGSTYFFSDGTWSTYELIEYILDTIPPSDVILTSFSISEDSLRHLLYLKESGKIKTLTGLFDPSIRKTKTPLLYFADEIFDKIRLGANHTKITLFYNKTRPVMLSGSANLGRNRRLETGVIDTDPKVFDFFHKYVQEYILSAQPI